MSSPALRRMARLRWGSGRGQARGHPASRRRAAAGSSHRVVARLCRPPVSVQDGRRAGPLGPAGGPPSGRCRWQYPRSRTRARRGRSGAGRSGRCRSDPAPMIFLPAEAAARQRSLGVWADAGYKPISTDQPDRLKERIGTFAHRGGTGSQCRRTCAVDVFELRRAMGRGFHGHHSQEDVEADDRARPGRRGVQGTACQGPRHFGGLARRVRYR